MPQYEVGEVVEVWSESQQTWIPGAKIVHAPPRDCEIDSYQVTAGTVKVEYEGRSKWLPPDEVSRQVRRPLAALAAAPAPPPPEPPPPRGGDVPLGGAGPSGAGRCKFGCGRSVQPGLTRGMKQYDTCCRRCAQNRGGGDHDPNCEGASPTAGTLEACTAAVDAHEWLKNLVESEEALQKRCEEVFREHAGEAELMDLDQFKLASSDLCRPVGETLDKYAKRLHEWAKYSPRSLRHPLMGAGIGVTSFKAMCRTILLDLYAHYFPRVLPFKTSELVRKNTHELTELYDMGDLLGQGSFGVVSMVTHKEFICDVMKQTLRALAFMHGERYMHKDLKPQNIMMVDKGSSSIKLIDFGLAEHFEPDEKVSRVFGGTLLYIAPEGFGRGLEMKSDVWSAGVILYNLITGDYPFMAEWPPPPGKDTAWWESGTRAAIQTEDPRDHPNLSNGYVSKDCVDMLCEMLSKDPGRRPDAARCLEHRWFKRFDREPPPLSVGILQCLDAFAGQPELKKAVFLLIWKT
ncbi:unnamed protein product, partial [Prorocentrum cordatum]